MTNTATVQFAASYLYDCCRKVREFVVEFSLEGMQDHRDLEAAMIRHARIHAPLSEHIVTLEGISSNWRHMPKRTAATQWVLN